MRSAKGEINIVISNHRHTYGRWRKRGHLHGSRDFIENSRFWFDSSEHSKSESRFLTWELPVVVVFPLMTQLRVVDFSRGLAETDWIFQKNEESKGRSMKVKEEWEEDEWIELFSLYILFCFTHLPLSSIFLPCFSSHS